MKNAMRRAPALLAFLWIASCGTPDPPNIRQEFGKGIMSLGVVPFYPLNESARLGQVYLVDSATAEKDGDSVSFVPTNVLLTEAAVPDMESARAARLSAEGRFPCSSDKLSEQISLNDQTRSYYQQATCTSSPPAQPAAAAATASAAATPGANTKAATASATQQGKASADRRGIESLTPLELAGIPSYSLASIDNVSVAGSVPTQFANFLAAIGLRRSTSLKVEAEAVEVAALPADQFAAAITKACTTPGNPFSDPRLARASMTFANSEMSANSETRQQYSSDQGSAYTPKLIMLRKVFYLRGILYIFSDTRAYSALLEAAASGGMKLASQPPVAPAISMNVVTAPQSGTQASKSDAEMAALQSQIDALRTAISSAANVQMGGTYARATARGIEFVEFFQRPLAFGYIPISEKFDVERGYEDFCLDARGEAITASRKEQM